MVDRYNPQRLPYTRISQPYREYIPQYRSQIPAQIGSGYREPIYQPPKKPFIGPFEKKLLLYFVLFVVIAVIVVIVLRSLSHSLDGYYHSSTGCHCKKNNNCGSHKKHQSNCGSHTKNSGHNSCGGS